MRRWKRWGGRRGHMLGIRNEAVARSALEELKRSGIISDFGRIDGRGIDYWITSLNNWRIYIEIKSSYRRAKVHRRRYRTPVVVIRNRKHKLPPHEERYFIMIAQQKILRLLHVHAAA